VFGISGFELLIILVFVLIIFGPDKLPQLARTIGSAMRMFKSAQADMERVIKAEMYTGKKEEIFGSSKAAATEPAAESTPAPAATATATATASSASSVWSVTSEDEEEEEDEE